MYTLKQHFIWLGLSIVITVFSLMYVINYLEIPVSKYVNYEHAKTAKAIGEFKWLPSWLPESAVNIREAHNIDTNQIWLEFYVDSLNSLTEQGCETVSQREYKKNYLI